MIKERNILTIETTAIILLWSLAFVSPLFFSGSSSNNWRAIHVMWTELGVIGFAFVVNRFILMPRLFFAKKYAQYILSLCGLLTIISLFIFYFDGVNAIISFFDGDIIIDSIPIEQRGRMGRPPVEGHGGFHPPQHPGGGGMPHVGTVPANTIIPPDIGVLILTMFIIALDMGLSLSVKWMVAEHKEALTNRERVSAQLSNLQNQISPHFFMNTLNNIHALVEIDPTRAQKTIIELSGLMDYLLYESSNMDRVSLHRELEFTQNYINLMRLRYPKRVVIDFKHSGNEPKVEIPPLLFLNFIENTFKYGVDYTKESFIRIYFNFSSSHIEMIAQNSNHSATTKSARHGLGIENSLKRLKLLYGNSYTLEISDKEGVYSVTLKISI